MTPSLARFDHLHVFVRNRADATQWYARVMNLKVVDELSTWAAGGGPLTLTNDSGSVHLALFEAAPQACRSTLALGVDAPAFLAWKAHLEATLTEPPRLQDHDLAWSLYFSDPDGNPYEITCYEHASLRAALQGARARGAQT